jgi:hypothetical protein
MAQIAILLFMLKMCGVLGRDFFAARRMFSPISFFAISFGIQFLGAEFFLPLMGFPVLGFEGTDVLTRIEATSTAQASLCVLLISFLAGFAPLYSLLKKPTDLERPFIPATKTTYVASWVWMVLGLAAAVFIGASWDGEGSRAQIVKGFSGQMGYAISFFASVGATLLLPSLYARRRFGLCILVVAFIALVFLPLGGRSRLLLPILQSGMVISIASGVRFRPKSLLAVGAGLLALMASLDPIMATFVSKRISLAQAVIEFISNLNIAYFFTSRNFDAFHNLSTIMYYDKITPNMNRIMGGAGSDWMQVYFPEIQARGFGYPPSVPGEFYLIAGWPGLVVGGLFLGMFFAFMQVAFNRTRKVSTLVIYAAALPWLGLGYAYFDFLLKDIAAVLPAIVLWLVDFIRTNPSARLAFHPASTTQRPGQVRDEALTA